MTVTSKVVPSKLRKLPAVTERRKGSFGDHETPWYCLPLADVLGWAGEYREGHGGLETS